MRNYGTPSTPFDVDQWTALNEKYGTDWYKWTMINWGTKWGCYDVEVATRATVTARPGGRSTRAFSEDVLTSPLRSEVFADLTTWGAWDAGRGEIVGESGGDGIEGVGRGLRYFQRRETIHLLADISG